MKKIIFCDINRHPKRIDFNIVDINDTTNEKYDIFFEFDFENQPSDIALSLAFCSMIKEYDEVYIDLPLPEELTTYLSSGLKAKVNCKSYIPPFSIQQNTSGNTMLLFSGGVDSVAAKILLPNTTKLISFDYGDQYSREYKIIKKFQTNVIHTNFRNTKFFKKMEKLHPPAFGIGSLLLCEYFSSFHVATGDILEASHDFNCYITHQVVPSSYIGMRQVRPTLGLTEFGTAKIVYNTYKDSPQLISEIIESVAPVGAVKRYRKELLLTFYGATIEIHPVKNLEWGQDYVFDFLSLYMYKHHNSHIKERLQKHIPKEVVDFINTHDLDFYEKVNPKTLISINSNNNINFYLKMLFKNGISLYTPKDFGELYDVRNILASYYSEINNHIKLLS